MNNRFFKTILILTLCVGITLPTNAAISVSDGSAFVTKAEFSADLNNLSNRMAQLENSLDSKIDSLVSSYLTRNGIWNAAKQELSAAVKDNRLYDFYPAFTTGNRGTYYERKVRIMDVVVPKTNKAGMAYGDFAYGNQHYGQANHWYYGIYNASNAQPGWIWDQNMCVTLSFYETAENVTSLTFDSNNNITNGELKSVIEIGKTLGILNHDGPGAVDNQIIVAIPLPQWNVVPFVFFVKKDTKIWWRWVDELSTYSLTAVNNHAASGSQMRVMLNGFSIY